MKTKKLLLILLAVVLIVAYYLLGTDYMEQRQEHQVLASQIAEAAGLKAEITAPPADLEQRLADARADLDAVKNTFPDRLNSTQVVNTILVLAEDTGVKAVPLVTQSWTPENINDNDYSVFRLNITVTGTFAQLTSFLSRLETGGIQTLVFEYLTINGASGPTGEESDQESTEQMEANLDIAIYSRLSATE